MAAVCSFALCTAAQGVNITIDGESMQAFGRDYNHMKGSPFLFEDWVKGTVKLTNGIVYENVSLMYDQVKDQLIFSTEDGKSFSFMYPVYEFTLQKEITSTVTDERKFRSGFPPVDGASAGAFYEVLNDGETILLKRASKAIVEERPDGSIVKEKLIKESVKYYIASPDKMVKINKSKKSILAAFEAPKLPQVETYIKTNRLSLKEEGHLIKVLAYYNTL